MRWGMIEETKDGRFITLTSDGRMFAWLQAEAAIDADDRLGS